MKKKLLIIAAVVVGIVLIGAAILFGTGTSPHTGIYLRAANGEHLVVVGNSPIVMLNENETRFSSLQDGDKILVFYGNINSVFPCQARVDVCLKLGKGDRSDVPARTLEELIQLGWISS